ncbi:MAG: glycosyltransferase [Pelosinus sp.]|nr:glycosyltransferase [Pelosinus sp.]
MLPPIAIGCPVRNRAWVLPDYLAALDTVSYKEKEYLFLLNNSTDTSKTILQQFLKTRQGQWQERVDEEVPGYRRGEYNANHFRHLAFIRNTFINMFLQSTSCQFLLSIDSDIIVPPDIISKLLALANNETIVAAAICNIPGRQLDGRMPGNFMINLNGCIQHPPTYPLAGTMKADVIGAVYLIPRNVLENNIRYASHPQGEDVGFCLAANAKGYKLLINLDAKCEHRMIEAQN